MTYSNDPVDSRDPRYMDRTDPVYVEDAPARPVQPVQPITPARRVDTDEAYAPSWRGWRAAQIIYTIGGIVIVLILIRAVLELLAANAGAGFTSFIYGLTDPLVAPFQGVFATPRSNGSVLDLAAILAIIVYAALTWVVARLVELVQRRSARVV